MNLSAGNRNQLQAPIVWAVAVVCCAASLGCAAFRSKNPVSDSVAACRQYAREGITAMETGDYREAEALLRQATGASPNDADARRHLAETLWARGEQEEALVHMLSATELEPNNPEAAVRYGQMLLARGRHEQAVGQALRALSLNPRAADAWALRGRAHRSAGDDGRALADLHQALLRNPESRDILADVAAIYYQSGRRQRELTTLHRLRDTYLPGEEPTELLAGEAEAYLALGRPQQAVERLRLACGRVAPSAPLLCRLAEAEAASGDANQARVTAARALDADANHQGARALVARLDEAVIR